MSPPARPPRKVPLIVKVTKAPDDPITPTRVSIGSVTAPDEPGRPVVGYYCVYRGTKEDAIAACEAALAGLRHLTREPPAVEPPRA